MGLERRGQDGRFDAWDLKIQGEYALQPGYSGSPLQDAASGNVVGVISHREELGRKGQAISVGVLESVWPDCPFGLFGDPETPGRASVPPGGTPLMNLTEEMAAFERIASGEDANTRLLLVHGPSGMGKTRLIEEYIRVANARGLETMIIPLDQQTGIDNCLSDLVYRLGIGGFPLFDEAYGAGRPHSPSRDQEQAWFRSLTMKFFRDLGQSREAWRLAVFFDPYEKADRDLKHWLSRDFVPAVCSARRLIAVVAGQETVDPRPTHPEHRHFELNGVEVEWYFRYAEACRIELDPDLVKTLHAVLHGCPKNFVEYVQSQRAGGTVQ